eukprot:TRINITY_DN7521_c0_g1_i1.p1 TRINITY_DN7521_c0_g1~~TRINITY_DN7521_c0_g1_i1.p1  ORF type:complete len:252 (-),score=19.78 TRINITY_DN7521_c0_g1_i1:363-1118(-)
MAGSGDTPASDRTRGDDDDTERPSEQPALEEVQLAWQSAWPARGKNGCLADSSTPSSAGEAEQQEGASLPAVGAALPGDDLCSHLLWGQTAESQSGDSESPATGTHEHGEQAAHLAHDESEAAADAGGSGGGSAVLSEAEYLNSQWLVHCRGACVPCAYHTTKRDGCRKGAFCNYCHFCDIAAYRKWKSPGWRRRRRGRKGTNNSQSDGLPEPSQTGSEPGASPEGSGGATPPSAGSSEPGKPSGGDADLL